MKHFYSNVCKIIAMLAFVLSTNLSAMAQTYSGGAGTVADPYQIANLTDLRYLSEHNADWNKHFKQTANIDASTTSTWNSGAGFSPIGSFGRAFRGSYEGQGNTITGLYINRPLFVNRYVGFFGFAGASGQFISNLGLVNCTIIGNSYVGGLIGDLVSGTVSNCYSTGNVTSNYNAGGGFAVYVGGLIGQISNGSVIKCYSKANVTGVEERVGGLVGFTLVSSVTISNCYATGNVSGGDDVGGLVGNNEATITNCYATGSVSASSGIRIGGLIGYRAQGSINNCFWDTQTSGITTSDGGTGKTTAEMQTQSTFTNWDFVGETTNGTADIWKMDLGCPNNGYPIFATQTTTVRPTTPSAGTDFSICSGATINLAASTVTGATYNWSGPNAFTSTSQNPSINIATAAMSGNYIVKAIEAGCSSLPDTVVVTVNPYNGLTIATANISYTYPITGITYFSNDCNNNLIAKVESNGASPISGSTTAKVWIEASQPPQYVKRHYEITPTTNASTATGRVTLYFTQAEFDDFNAVNTIKLPTGTADATGIANLLIEKRSGVSSDGSGLPGTYTGTTVTINPADANIVWNAAQSRWEVTFDVTGFSGFFVKTLSGILPLHWLTISGNLNAQKQAVINFTVNENNVNNYILERTTDNNNWTTVGTLVSKGNGENYYQFTDASTLQGITYYRVKKVDINNRYSFSTIIKLSNYQIDAPSIYPNPVKDVVTISGAKVGKTLLLTDISGKVLQQIKVAHTSFTMDMSKYNAGVYLLRTENGITQKIIIE